MPGLKIDGRLIEAAAGLTVLEAARERGIAVPSLCDRPGRPAVPSCLVCVVRDEASGRLFPSCAESAAEGMDVRTNGPEVEAARRTALGLLAAEHQGDCESPCTRGCPLGIDFDLVIGILNRGGPHEVHEAAAALLERNPFPSIMGRLCVAPCEKVCRRGRLDAAVSIKMLEKYLGDGAGDILPAKARATGKKAAVVGAGPAGLAAAYRLLRLGHAVVMYEKSDRAGGGMRAALAEDDDGLIALDREITRIRILGAEFIFNTEAGKDVSFEELAAHGDALLIACGTSFEASRPGVFAAGARAGKTDQAVHALKQGQEAAEAVHAFLGAGRAASGKRRFDSHLKPLDEDELAVFLAAASRGPRNPKAAGDFTGPEAAQEARRCLACACLKREACAFREAVTAHGPERRARLEARPAYRRDDSHSTVLLEPGKCIKCGRCVRITRERGEPVGLAFSGRGFDMTIGAPAGRTLAEALTFTAEECAAACPTAALARKPSTGMHHE